MDFPLQPVSKAGRSFVALCDAHEQAFFSRANENDPGGVFPRENIEDAVKSGVVAATVPEGLGGIGVISLRDHAAGMTRLGRGDGSTAIALNMHLFRVWGIARVWRAARITGADVRACREFAGRLVPDEGRTRRLPNCQRLCPEGQSRR